MSHIHIPAITTISNMHARKHTESVVHAMDGSPAKPAGGTSIFSVIAVAILSLLSHFNGG